MNRDKWPLAALGFLLAIFLASGILFLPLPPTRDQGIYAYVAWCWLGEWWPYQFAFEHKGPWLYLLYAIFLKLSKGAFWGPNLADLLARISTVSLVFILARTALDAKRAAATALFAALPLLAVFSSCWWNAQAETFMMPLAAAGALFAFLAATREQPLTRMIGAMFSGACMSQMLFFKPSAVWLSLAILLFLLLSAEKNKWLAAAVFLASLAAGIALWIGYFRLRGIGREFFEEVVLFNWFHLHGPRKPFLKLTGMFSRELWLIFGPALLLLAVGAWRALKNRKQPAMALALLWFAAALLEIFSQARFFLYHLLGLIPSAAILMAIGSAPGTAKSSRLRKWAVWLIALSWIFLAARFYWQIQNHYQTLDYLCGKIDRGQYYALFQEPAEGPGRDFNAYADLVVAGWIRERTMPDDYVLVFGYEPLINYLAARRAPSRFHSDYPLDFAPSSELAIRLRDRWRGIFLNDLETRKPKLVVLAHNDINALEQLDSYHQALAFREFWQWLNQGYERRERIEDFEFWWRRDK